MEAGQEMPKLNTINASKTSFTVLLLSVQNSIGTIIYFLPILFQPKENILCFLRAFVRPIC